jgi:hypothetical protein
MRIRWIIGLAAAVLAVGSCSLTEDRHFGISMTPSGDVAVWFIDCYAPPWSVSVYREENRAPGDPAWRVTQIGDAAFPTTVVVGDTPAGYRLSDDSLEDPLEPDVEYIAAFSRGEAYGELLTFIPSELSEDVLTFDRQKMTPEEFRDQGCDKE